MEISTTSVSSHDESERIPLLISHQQRQLTDEQPDARRWLMMVICALNAFVSGLLLGGMMSIKAIAIHHYGITLDATHWTAYIFLLTSACFSIPISLFITKYGIRKTLIVISLLHTITTIFHVFSYQKDRYLVFMFGQIPAALAYSMLLPLLTKLSLDWFPLRERASSTSFFFFSCIFGFAVSIAVGTCLVKDYHNAENEIRNLVIGRLVFAIVAMVATLFGYRERNIYHNRIPNIDPLALYTSLKKLVMNRDFLLMSQSYGIYFGLAITLLFQVNPLLMEKFPKGHGTWIGWLGFALIMISYLSTLIFGLWLGRFSSHRSMAIMLNVLSLAVWLLFTLLFIETATFFFLFVVYLGIGLVALPYIYLGPEHAVELTYPIDEALSTGFIVAFGNLYSFVFLLSFGTMTTKGYFKSACLGIFSIYILSSAFAVASRSFLRRRNASTEQVTESPVTYSQ